MCVRARRMSTMHLNRRIGDGDRRMTNAVHTLVSHRQARIRAFNQFGASAHLLHRLQPVVVARTECVRVLCLPSANHDVMTHR